MKRADSMRQADAGVLPDSAASRRHEILEASLARRAVEHTLEALEPTILRLIADATISAEHAMHVVVMDPTADPRSAFERAILVERSFGNPTEWRTDYVWYARAKARVSWRERRTLRTPLTQAPDLLQPDAIRVEGAVREGRWIIGASGAQAWYDDAIAAVVIRLILAALAHARMD